MKQHGAAWVAAKELDNAPLGSVESQIGAQHLPIKSLFCPEREKQEKIQELGSCFIELRRVALSVKVTPQARVVGFP